MPRIRWGFVVAAVVLGLLAGNAFASPPPWAHAAGKPTTTTAVGATTTTKAPRKTTTTQAATTTTAGPTTTTLAATTTTGAMPTTTSTTIGGAIYDRDYVVAKTGNDANSGLPGSPLLTISAAVTKALTDNSSGLRVRILVSPGVYREKVTIGSGGTSAAMALQATDVGVVVSGADLTVAGDWTASDAPNRIYFKTWTNNWGVQAWPSGWPTDLGTDVLRRREIVVVDGVWVRQVLTSGELTSYDAAYYVDEAADRLYLRYPTGKTPATASVEVATRDATLTASSRPNLTVRGITFQHAATLMQNSGVDFTGCTNLLVEDVTARGMSWTGISYNQATGMTARRVHSDQNGANGYGSFRGQQLLMEDGTSSQNGLTRAAWAAMGQWDNGAGKLFETRTTTLRNYTTTGNYGPGPWWDTDNKNVLVEDLKSYDNGDFGLFIERTQGPVTIRRAKLTGNAHAGLQVNHSLNVTLEDSTLWDNEDEIGFGDWNAPLDITEWDNPGTTYNVDGPHDCTVRNNLIWGSTTGPDRYLVAAPHTFTYAETWRTTFTASGNAYYSSTTGFPGDTPFVGTNSNDTSNYLNFTGWKTYLGGSRDSTSTYSTSAPSPLPSL